jgi:hypothetical protein
MYKKSSWSKKEFFFGIYEILTDTSYDFFFGPQIRVQGEVKDDKVYSDFYINGISPSKVQQFFRLCPRDVSVSVRINVIVISIASVG